MNPERSLQRLHAIQQEIITCRSCPRLVAWRERVGVEKRRAYRDWDYWSKPVPAFGDPLGRVAIVGLAPGAHGSNRTGRMFTGDSSGDFLFPALHTAGFANQPAASHMDDGMELRDLIILAVCRCAPPDNKPLPVEIAACRRFYTSELDALPNLKVVVALGKIAFDQLCGYFSTKLGTKVHYEFSHGVCIKIPGLNLWFVGAYHPSRQNTQTKRLTTAMYTDLWDKVKSLLAVELY